MNTKGTGATFRELSSWATLASITLAYLVVVIGAWPDPTSATRLAYLIGGAIVFQIIVLIVSHALLAAVTNEQPSDERDAAIELRSTRWSKYILCSGVILTIGIILVQQIIVGSSGEMDNSETLLLHHPLLIGHVLIGVLFFSEVVRLGTQAVDYRRGV